MVLTPVQNSVPTKTRASREAAASNDAMKLRVDDSKRATYQRKAKGEPILNGLTKKTDSTEKSEAGKSRTSGRKSIAPIRYTNENAAVKEKTDKVAKRMSEDSVNSNGKRSRPRSSNNNNDESPSTVKVPVVESEKQEKPVKPTKSEPETEVKKENGITVERVEAKSTPRVRGRPRKYGPSGESLERRGRPQGSTKEAKSRNKELADLSKMPVFDHRTRSKAPDYEAKQAAAKEAKAQPKDATKTEKSEKSERRNGQIVKKNNGSNEKKNGSNEKKNGGNKRSKPSSYADIIDLPRKRFCCPIPLSLPADLKHPPIKSRKEAYKELKRLLDHVPDESIGNYFEQVRAFSVYLQDSDNRFIREDPDDKKRGRL